jgi:hypothetical protein
VTVTLTPEMLAGPYTNPLRSSNNTPYPQSSDAVFISINDLG